MRFFGILAVAFMAFASLVSADNVNINFNRMFEGLKTGTATPCTPCGTCNNTLVQEGMHYEKEKNVANLVQAIDNYLGPLLGGPIDWVNNVYGVYVAPPQDWSGVAIRPEGFPSEEIGKGEGGYERMMNENILAFYMAWDTLDAVYNGPYTATDSDGNYIFVNEIVNVYSVPGHPEKNATVIEIWRATFDKDTDLQIRLEVIANDANLLKLAEYKKELGL